MTVRASRSWRIPRSRRDPVDHQGVLGAGGWALGLEPVLSIGALGGDPAYQLFRVEAAKRLDDGGVAVLNSGTSQLRLYGPDGIHRADIGGEGEGPGEFMAAADLARWPGDSLAVWDSRTRRLTLFAPDGSLGRTMLLESIESMERPTFAGVAGDRRILATGSDLGFSPDKMPGTGVLRPDMSVAVLDAEGRQTADLGNQPGTMSFLRVGAGSINIFRSGYHPKSVATAVGEYVVSGATETDVLHYQRLDGTLARLVHLGESPRRLTESERAAEIERHVAEVPERARAGIRRMYEDLPIPDTLPVFDEVVPGPRGQLWVRLFQLPRSDGPATWIVLDADGRAVAKIETPAGADLLEAGPDYLLVRSTDELDVERVQIWPLERSGG